MSDRKAPATPATPTAAATPTASAKLADLIRAAQRASVPLVAVSTPDPAATIEELLQALAARMPPEAIACQWDLLTSLVPLGDEERRKTFNQWLADTSTDPSTLEMNPVQAVAAGAKLPPASVLFIHLANRFLEAPAFVQATWNLRDRFKRDHRMLVLLGPQLTLPPEIAGDVLSLDEPLRRLLHAAWHETDYERAKKQLLTTVRWLERLSPDAANSLREGMEETLTVVKLGLPELLRRTLATTNPIESALSVTRTVTARVTRWRDGDMRQRWCIAGLLRAEQKFRRIKGFRHLPDLARALQREIDPPLLETNRKSA